MTDYSTKIAALEDAMASGELRVESDGEVLVYRSISDLKAALDYFKQQTAATASPTPRPASTLAVYDPN